MSFTNPVEVKNNTHCWANTYKWSGGQKIVTNPDGTQEPKLFAEIRHYDKNANNGEGGNISQEARMKMAIVGFTTAVGGFNGDKDPASQVRYYSNEVLSTFDQPLTVFASNKQGTEKLYDNVMYSEIKKDPKRPQGLKYMAYIYFYNFDTKQIDRFEMAGSALSAWIELDKKDGIVHKRWTIMKAGDMKINGSVTFIPPVLEYGDMFTPEEIKEITSSDAYHAYEEFEKRIGNGQVEMSDGIDQTPAYYDGEQSQEPAAPAPAPQANVTNLDGVPF